MKRCNHDSHEKFNQLIGPLTDVCRQLGYAVAVHGSLVRDIDLIAVPWTDEAVDAKRLAEAVLDAAGKSAGFAFVSSRDVGRLPEMKPHGRLCWRFHFGGGPYIDLSVLPRKSPGARTCPDCGGLGDRHPGQDCETPCATCEGTGVIVAPAVTGEKE